MERQTLTARQQQILDHINDTVNERGYPPAVREIGEAVGLSSPSTVHSHLSALVKAGDRTAAGAHRVDVDRGQPDRQVRD